MTDLVLSVRWKDHTSELAAVYKSLFENNFLVDCTISVEGQSLKAHKLVLSACSPYFHRLFQEETEKHTVLIILDASFETLKAVINFVYQGETQIPRENLQSFLTLAQSLQIKGLNDIVNYHRNKNISSGIAGNRHHRPFEENKDTFANQTIGVVGRERSSENSSQLQPHHSNSYPDAVLTNSSLPFEGHREYYCGIVESSEMPPSQQQHMQLSDEVSSGQDAEQDDILLPVVFVPCGESEELLDEPVEVVYDSNEMAEGREPACLEQDISHGSSEVCILPENDEGRGCAEGAQEPRPSQSEEQPHAASRARKRQHSGDGNELVPAESQAPATAVGAATAGHSRTLSRERPFGCDLCGMAFASRPTLVDHRHSHTGVRPHACDLCDKAFVQKQDLASHRRTHTGERPYRCDVCGEAFARSDTLGTHKRTHTGARPYRCDVCGLGFHRPSILAAHKNTHSGVQPFRCVICEKGFSNVRTYNLHMTRHVEERL